MILLAAEWVESWKNLPSSVVYVETENAEKMRGIGSAFHIGSGYFATARHVIEDVQIRSVGRRDMSLKTRLEGGQIVQTTTYPAFSYNQGIESFFHPDKQVDVAIFQLTGEISGVGPARVFQPVMELAQEADILSEGELLMTDVYVAGFPPISQADDAYLVILRGEISAVIRSRADKKRHFVISGMARGGFSGGPVFLLGNPTGGSGTTKHYGKIVGVVGRSLTDEKNSNELTPEQLGFLAAVSIETVRETITHNRLPIKL